MKAAVVAFEDGTEPFADRGSYVSGYVFNLAKAGINGLALNAGAAFSVSPLPPELWAKSFAEDLRASGIFRSVAFVFTLSELSDEDLVVEGLLTKAYFHTKRNEPDEFALNLRARRAAGGSPVWEGEIRKTSAKPPGVVGILGDYRIDRVHAYLSGVMQGMFAEARGEIVRAVAAPATTEPAPSLGDSPEEVIRRILGPS